MKEFRILLTTLCLSCASLCTYASDIGVQNSAEVQTLKIATFQIFTDVDNELAKLYPETLKGFDNVDASIVPIARSVNQKFSTPASLQYIPSQYEALLTFRSYYLGKLRQFMDTLLKKRDLDANPEFMSIWNNISTEIDEASQCDITDSKWFLYQTSYLRALILASGGGSAEAQDLLSTVPNMHGFFGALLDTPSCLMKPDQKMVPAWKHSNIACILNTCDDETRGNIFHPRPYPLGVFNYDFDKKIKKEAYKFGLSQDVYIPMPGDGKIGLTTIVKMWLQHAYPIPLTYGEYEAHAVKLGAAVGALHDKAHGEIDNRHDDVYHSILNRLRTAQIAGKSVTRLMPIATQHMVERYNLLNNTLLRYVENKERIIIDALNAARALAPDDKNNSARKAAEILARKEYNVGVAALFETLHEQLRMLSSVFEAPTFAVAMDRLCGILQKQPTAAEISTPNEETVTTESDAEIEKDKRQKEFNILDTYFTPESDLTDEAIIDKIKDTTLESIGVYPLSGVNEAVNATTIREYEGRFDFTTATISRGRIYTEIQFDDIITGKRIKMKIPTTHYLVNTSKDTNKVLGLIGQKVDESIFETVNNMYRANALSKEAALEEIKNWYVEVKSQTTIMLSNLAADVLAHTPADAIFTYNETVARQNAEWDAIVNPVKETTAGPTVNTGTTTSLL